MKHRFLRMGETVEQICKNLKADIPIAQYLTPTGVKEVAEFDTTLRKLKPAEFQLIFRHGYEVCSAVLYGIKRFPFSEYKQSNYPWMKE